MNDGVPLKRVFVFATVQNGHREYFGIHLKYDDEDNIESVDESFERVIRQNFGDAPIGNILEDIKFAKVVIEPLKNVLGAKGGAAIEDQVSTYHAGKHEARIKTDEEMELVMENMRLSVGRRFVFHPLVASHEHWANWWMHDKSWSVQALDYTGFWSFLKAVASTGVTHVRAIIVGVTAIFTGAGFAWLRGLFNVPTIELEAALGEILTWTPTAIFSIGTGLVSSLLGMIVWYWKSFRDLLLRPRNTLIQEQADLRQALRTYSSEDIVNNMIEVVGRALLGSERWIWVVAKVKQLVRALENIFWGPGGGGPDDDQPGVVQLRQWAAAA